MFESFFNVRHNDNPLAYFFSAPEQSRFNVACVMAIVARIIPRVSRSRAIFACVDKLSTVETYVIVVRKPDYILV